MIPNKVYYQCPECSTEYLVDLSRFRKKGAFCFKCRKKVKVNNFRFGKEEDIKRDLSEKFTTNQKRKSDKYEEWREAVLRRDDYTCQQCGSHKNLTVHHILHFAKNEKARYEVWNGITECKKCHEKKHSKGLEILENY